jgi:hypothetical protein
LLAAKSLSGVVELSTTHLRKQFDAPTKQSNDHREAPKAAAAGDQLALAEQYAPGATMPPKTPHLWASD